MCVCVNVYVCTSKYVCVHVCVYLHVCVCVHLCVCGCVRPHLKEGSSVLEMRHAMRCCRP